MAKFEARIKGDFDKVLSKIEQGILSSSKEISLADKSDFLNKDTRCSVRVYYYLSFIKGSAASLNITLFQSGNDYIELSAISTGDIPLLPIKSNEEILISKLQEVLQKNFKQ